MNKIEIIGYLGALATTFTLLPQMIQTIRTKDTKGLSLTMYIIMLISNVLWVSYGVFSLSYPIIFCQLLIAPMAITILVCKLKYK